MAVESTMITLGSKAPAFDLPIANPWIESSNAATRAFESYPEAQVYVVIFTCNHCPYAVHVEKALVNLAQTYAPKGVQFIAICSNDAAKYPDDSFENMAKRARAIEMPFPYLHDESQAVARAYQAACTPDIYVYDAGLTLRYRGRFDETRPNMGTAHGGDLKTALDLMLNGEDVPEKQYPSIGCSIKWK